MIFRAHEGPATGAENMARDLALAERVSSGSLDLGFRTYTWSPWALSLGRHQTPDVVEHDILKARGFDLVQRPTGGRAVLHAEELTYCFVIRSTSPKAVYARVHELLLTALESVLPDTFTHTSRPTDLREHYAATGSLGKACFSANAPTEIMAGSRKVVGSAQRILSGDVILQHGSILMGPAHLLITDILAISETDRETLRATLQSSSVSLSELAAEPPTTDELAEAILRTFSEDRLRNFHDLTTNLETP